MELNDNELNNVVVGIKKEDAENNALENKELYRESSIEKLQNIKDQLNDLKTKELSMEELEEVKAGHQR